MSSKTTEGDKIIRLRRDVSEATRKAAAESARVNQMARKVAEANSLAARYRSERDQALSEANKPQKPQGFSAAHVQRVEREAYERGEDEGRKQVKGYSAAHVERVKAESYQEGKRANSNDQRKLRMRVRELEITLEEERKQHAKEVQRLTRLTETHKREATEARAKLEANDGTISPNQ